MMPTTMQLRTPTGSGIARVVFATFVLLSCENALDYGSRPRLLSAGGEAGQGDGAGTASGMGGTAADSLIANRTSSEAPSAGGADEGFPEGVIGGSSSEGFSIGGSGGSGEGSESGRATAGSGGSSEGSESGGATAGSGGQAEPSTPLTVLELPTGYSCSVDVGEATSDCTGPVQVTSLSAQMGTLAVDMSAFKALTLEVEVVDPSGYVLDIGDSYCSDGGGGDCGAVSNDAELEVTRDSQGGFPLTLWASDAVVTNPDTTVLATIPAFFNATGTTQRTLYLSDGKLRLDGTAQWWESPALLRLGAPDTEGTTDSMWYIGLNRVVWNALRSQPRIGSGIRKATLRLH